MTSVSNANIARHLGLMAAAQPARPALKIPRGRSADGRIVYLTLSFAELDAEVAGWQARLAAAGVRRGDRTLVMVKPGLPLIAVVFALFRTGAVPVVIDPGMGLRNFLSCVAQSRPRALVGIPLARFLSRVFRRSFSSVAVRVPVDASPTARVSPAGAAGMAENAATDLAAILFTSGSTGAPKGVCYEHGMFEAQVRMIREAYDIEPGEVDLPMLPIFALFNPALGMTTVVPEMDPRRPAAVDPARIVQAIRQENVTNSFGSPTLWLKVSEYCEREHITLPTLRRVLSAGAPVPAALWENSRRLLPSGRLHSPYGATEALPVATVSSTEIDPAGVRGACVGRPLPGITVRIIALTDEPIPSIDAVRDLPTGEVGEIIVQGPVVTRQYDAMPAATALAKIPAPDGTVWHRMGDCGFLDYSSRLWFTGRKAERVVTAEGTMFTEPCEQVFRQHPEVKRCALVGLGPRGRQQPAVVVETPSAPSLRAARAFAAELRALALRHPHTSRIRRFYFRPRFPVDVRHNAKIHRLTLTAWAARAPGIEVPATP
ncbi:MAG TPA: fatty acid CoA ligase family protein [Opitutaceae bacterium]|nr:fatty acid CoA ligase family protein [Opitutaceae bacterium]HND60575.1 fatty acid CoA ligase family protein [Opitutaceae bacterium]